MAGPIKRALVEMGYRVREYSPVGELLPGMSYLVRRLLENTSNEGFLRAKFSDNLSAAQLLRDPNELIARARAHDGGDRPESTAFCQRRESSHSAGRHLQKRPAGQLRSSPDAGTDAHRLAPGARPFRQKSIRS